MRPATILPSLLAAVACPAAEPDPSPESLDPNFAVVQPGSELRWYDAQKLTLVGAGWPAGELAKPYDRLPARAEAVVRPAVWSLSRHSAGLEIRFRTDASEIGARWTVRHKNLAMDHMPATGVSGLDLYVHQEAGWRWLGVGRPTQSPTNLVKLAGGIPAAGMRAYRVYLPLYNALDDLQIGVPAGAKLQAAPAPAARPVVVYGTSIVQGGCASRPGMVYSAILGRQLEVPMINLGFSGNGQAEPEVAALVAELDPAVFVLDPLPNLTPAQVGERIEPFVAALRAKHPQTPIVLVGNITYQHAQLGDPKRSGHYAKNSVLDPIAGKLMQGDPRIFYVRGETLLGDDGEATVDGTHATDLGFLRMAAAIRPTLEQALKAAGR